MSFWTSAGTGLRKPCGIAEPRAHLVVDLDLPQRKHLFLGKHVAGRCGHMTNPNAFAVRRFAKHPLARCDCQPAVRAGVRPGARLASDSGEDSFVQMCPAVRTQIVFIEGMRARRWRRGEEVHETSVRARRSSRGDSRNECRAPTRFPKRCLSPLSLWEPVDTAEQFRGGGAQTMQFTCAHFVCALDVEARAASVVRLLGVCRTHEGPLGSGRRLHGSMNSALTMERTASREAAILGLETSPAWIAARLINVSPGLTGRHGGRGIRARSMA
jgi:hypothetical protein